MNICLLSEAPSDASNTGGIIFAVILCLVFFVVLPWALAKRRKEKEAAALAAEKEAELRLQKFNESLNNYLQDFQLNGLPQVTVSYLQLASGEVCHFYSEAIHCKIKNRVVGYRGGYGGHSVRIAKGWSIRIGSTAKQAVRDDVEFTSEGHLCVTNKKIIFIAPTNSKCISLNSVVSLNIYKQYVVILNSKEENMFEVPVENRALLLSVLQTLFNNTKSGRANE